MPETPRRAASSQGTPARPVRTVADCAGPATRVQSYDFQMIRFATSLAGLLATVFAFSGAAADHDGALQGADSLVERAIRHEHGEGVARNTARAAELYCAAARQGNAEAAYRLGWMFANGRGIERDDGYAVALFERAAAQGHEYAERMLTRIHSDDVRLPDCVAAPVSALLAKAAIAQMEQLALADRARAEAAIAELATAEQLARAARARAQAAKIELARAEQLAREEEAKATSAIGAAAGPVRARAELVERELSDIRVALARWTEAWSRKDLKAYLAAYARDFVVPGGRSLQQWKRERRLRIAEKTWIDVKIRALDIRVEGSRASARFLQDYRSDRLSESGSKTLTLIKAERTWLIRQEQSAR